MADSVSLVAGDDEPGGDGMVLTDLANKLVARIPTLCMLKTFYDGMEKVPTRSIPKSTNQNGYAVYQRFVSICQLNLAKPMLTRLSTVSVLQGSVWWRIRRCVTLMRMTCGLRAVWS